MIRTSEIFDRIKVLPPVARISLYVISGLLILGIVGWSVSNLIDAYFPARPPTTNAAPGPGTSTPTSTTPTYSPLIFGTNLQLSDAHDQVLTSQPTRTLLQQLHLQIIRVTMNASLSEQTELQAATDVKNLGASLDLVLEGPLDPTALQDDSRIIHDINTLFGTATVYYEFGNEQDLMGVSSSQYVTSWNHIIPQLKALAPHGHFIGPVTYRYDQAYLQTFLTQATPRPDEVSWHEYTCTASDPQSTCLAQLNSWSTHITSARALMTSTIGHALPIMITAWNYAPDARATDGKSTDSAFMSQWTQKAMQTLLANHILASMQYSCTNTAAPLIASNNTLTTQGTAFQNLYTQVMKTMPGNTPAPSPSAIARVQPTATAHAKPRPTTPPTRGTTSPPTSNPTAPTSPATNPTSPTLPAVPTTPPSSPSSPSSPKPTPTPIPIASLPAASCSSLGTLVIYDAVYSGSTKIGELDVYYNSSTGDNCAEFQSLGSSRGVAKNMYVSITVCQQTTSSSTCTPISSSNATRSDNGTYQYYAGPVGVYGAGHCIRSSGGMVWKGVTYQTATSPAASHCG